MGKQARRIVAGKLDHAGAPGGCTVVFIDDRRLHRLQATLVVCADWNNHHNEGVLRCRGNANLRTGTNQQWTDVQGGASPKWRNPVLIRLDDTLDCLAEHLHGNRSHAGATGGTDQTLRILLDTEDADLAVLATIGLQTLKGRLPIVKALGRNGEGDEGLVLQFARIPLAILPMVFHVIRCGKVGKTQFRPV